MSPFRHGASSHDQALITHLADHAGGRRAGDDRGLLVIWIIGQASEEHWAFLTVGTIFIALIMIGMVVYFIWTIKEYRLNRRQANFIDSVTHELKSPIASIKLCLQTLDLRSVGPEQQRE